MLMATSIHLHSVLDEYDLPSPLVHDSTHPGSLGNRASPSNKKDLQLILLLQQLRILERKSRTKPCLTLPSLEHCVQQSLLPHVFTSEATYVRNDEYLIGLEDWVDGIADLVPHAPSSNRLV